MVISFIYLPRYRISPILNMGSIDMLVFLFPPEVCSSVNHGPHSKKAFSMPHQTWKLCVEHSS